MKIEIYDSKERHIGSTRVFSFPKTLFKSSTVPITIKCNKLPTLKKGESIMLVFEYINGSRHRGMARVDSASKTEIETKVGEVTEIEERRRSFKVNTKEKAIVYKSKKSDAREIGATILNINLGGVLLKCEEALIPGEQIYLNTLNGELEVYTKVLRKQHDINGTLVGYGCQFLEVTEQQEAIIAKYIMDCQVAERERRKTLDDLGMA